MKFAFKAVAVNHVLVICFRKAMPQPDWRIPPDAYEPPDAIGQ